MVRRVFSDYHYALAGLTFLICILLVVVFTTVFSGTSSPQVESPRAIERSSRQNIQHRLITPAFDVNAMGYGFFEDGDSKRRYFFVLENETKEGQGNSSSKWKPVIYINERNYFSYEKIVGASDVSIFDISFPSTVSHYLDVNGMFMIDILMNGHESFRPLVFTSQTGGKNWIVSQPLPENTTEASGAFFDGQFHIVAYDENINSFVHLMRKEGKEWKSKILSPLPLPLKYAPVGSAIHDGKVYYVASVASGTADSKPVIIVYDLRTNDLVSFSDICAFSYDSQSLLDAKFAFGANGAVYVLYTLFFPAYDFNVKFGITTDDGLSWSNCVNTQPSQFFTSVPHALTVDGDDIYYFVNNGFDANRIYVVRSLNAGASWLPRQEVYSHSSPEYFASQPVGYYMLSTNEFLINFVMSYGIETGAYGSYSLYGTFLRNPVSTVKNS
jgi:hypothetical protein